MVLKSYAKINLSLIINKKLKNGLHNIQSIYYLIDLYDKIYIKKIKNKKFDRISFYGPFSKDLNQSNNSVKKILNLMRKKKLIFEYYSVKIYKNIPVFAGFGGGTSNAATLLNYLSRKKLNKNVLNKMAEEIGSDLRLFFYNRGYQKNLKSVIKLRKKYQFYFLLAFPRIKNSTKHIYSKVRSYSSSINPSRKDLSSKERFIKFIVNSKNDLQSIVEKRHSVTSELLKNISYKGCHFSRMTGSGSACYGLFTNKNCTKVALKKLRKKYPKFWFSIAKTI